MERPTWAIGIQNEEFDWWYPMAVADAPKFVWEHAESYNDGVAKIQAGYPAISFAKTLRSGTFVGNIGARSIATALKGNTTCHALWLDNTFIGAGGGQAIAEALLDNHALMYLYIGNNDIHDDAARMFAQALEVNTTLTHLSMSNNCISPAVIGDFVNALKENKSISLVYLSIGNGQSDGIKEDQLSELRQLVDWNRMGYVQKRKAFQEALKMGKTSWNRSKLMFIGQGRAGKTATVRSLLDEPFNAEWISTVGASLSQIQIEMKMDEVDNDRDHGWKKTSPDVDHLSRVAGQIARKVIEETSENQKPPCLLDEKEQEIAKRKKKLRAKAKAKTETETETETKKAKIALPETEEAEVVMPQNDTAVLPPIMSDADIAHKFDSIMISDDLPGQDALSFTIWDYGGQTVFYTLHHLFLTQYGTYLLVFDMRDLLQDKQKQCLDYLEFWLSSLRLHAPDAQLLLVGSHLDMLEDTENSINMINVILGDFFKAIGYVDRALVNETDELLFFPVSNKDGVGIKNIRRTVETVTRGQYFVNMEIPLRWVRCLDLMLEQRDSNWLSLARVKEIGRDVGVTSDQETSEMLELFHNLGMVVHLTSTEALRGVVTINPQWLLDKLCKIIRDNKLHVSVQEWTRLEEVGLEKEMEYLTTNGVTSRDLLEFLWDKTQVDFLLDLMRETMLVCDWRFPTRDPIQQANFLIPSMVNKAEENLALENDDLKCVFTAEDGYMMPIGVFQRLVCLLVSYSGRRQVLAEPVLGTTMAKVYMKPDECIILGHNRSAKHIYAVFSNESTASEGLTMILSMFQKLKQVMTTRFTWKTSLRIKDIGYVNYEKARKLNMKPWFTSNKNEAYPDSHVNVDRIMNL